MTTRTASAPSAGSSTAPALAAPSLTAAAMTAADPGQDLGADFRATFRVASSSVWVVTTERGGEPVGFTAISLVSVSISPLLVSFNVSRTSSSLPALLATRRLAAHLLAGDQEHLARRFAADAARRFSEGSSWSWAPDGLPALDGVVARLSGQVASVVDAGDSVLVVAEVTGALTRDGIPLTHRDRTYAPAPVTIR
jgi:flavin reductase (DIM6/NTAB) family NADH-FMN oxidoreductase RutF